MQRYLAQAFSSEIQRNELSHPSRAAWIAFDPHDQAIGYAMLRRDSVANGLTAVRPAEVERIYVESVWHGRGVGKALMLACFHQAHTWECDAIWLGVWERNPRAIAFYEKSGFQAMGQQTFVLGRDVQNDIVMARPLG